MKIAIIGAGYVGCVTAACFARRGHDIIAVDTLQAKVDEINRGESPILEPGLPELIAEAVRAGRLRATSSADAVLGEVDIAFVCVATPSLPNGDVDTQPIQRVFQRLSEAAARRREPLTVVIRSTIAPPRLRGILDGLGPAARSGLRVVANPEFLREATAIADFEKPPMIVVGSDDEAGMDKLLELYRGIEAPTFRLDLETSLLVKYACNAFHGLKIAFANEIATVAEMYGANALKVMEVFAEDRILNISKAYLRPGFAFGGSCLPKDLRALVSLGQKGGEALPVMAGALESNRRRIDRIAELISHHPARRLTMLGISFKKGSDDVRESPYLLLAERLVQWGIDLRIHDPDIAPERLIGKNLDYLDHHVPRFKELFETSLEKALDGTEGVILCKRLVDKAALADLVGRGVAVYDVEYLAAQAGLPVPSPYRSAAAVEAGRAGTGGKR